MKATIAEYDEVSESTQTVRIIEVMRNADEPNVFISIGSDEEFAAEGEIILCYSLAEINALIGVLQAAVATTN